MSGFYGSRRSPYHLSAGSGAGGGVMLSSYGGSPTEVSRRQVSSTVVREDYLDSGASAKALTARGGVQYVEVPVIEEVIKRVPKREIVEVEKYVPRVEYEYVEKIVEVPRIEWVERQVEIPQYQEVVKQVKRREVIDVPREYVRRVPKIETVVVEKTVEVPGQIIEVPKPYTVENHVPVQQYIDNEVPLVVAQTVRPVVAETDEVVDVDVYEYEPEFITVDVEVPKAVPLPVIDYGVVDEAHRVVTVPAAQYNSILRMLNSHIADVEQSKALPFMSQDGMVPFLHGLEANTMYPAPIPTAHIEGWVPKVPHSSRHHRSHQHRSTTRGRRNRYSRRPAYYDYYQTEVPNGEIYDPYAFEEYDGDYMEDEYYYPQVRARDYGRKAPGTRSKSMHSRKCKETGGRQCKCCA